MSNAVIETQETATKTNVVPFQDTDYDWDRLNGLSDTDLDRGIAMGLFGSASGRAFKMALAIRTKRRHDFAEESLASVRDLTESQLERTAGAAAEARAARQAAMVAGGISVVAVAAALVAMMAAFGVLS